MRFSAQADCATCGKVLNEAMADSASPIAENPHPEAPITGGSAGPGGSAGDARALQRSWAIFAAVSVLIFAVVLYAVSVYGRATALSTLEAEGRTAANLKIALLHAVLERPRALPFLLSQDRDVQDALKDDTEENRHALDRKLEGIIAGTNAAVIYVVGRDGVAISASNWREATSFVGNDYSFREYFSRGMREGKAEHFALGSVSNRPGLYISHRVGPADHPIGVVVVKMEFDQLEGDWSETRRPSYVTDDHGVVLITSIPSWRFFTTTRLSTESLAAIRQSLQFGGAPLTRLPMLEAENLGDDASIVRVSLPGTEPADYLRITKPVATTSWNFSYLQPIEVPLSAAVREAQLGASLLLAAAIAVAAMWLWRRQVAQLTIAREQWAREELERRVVERTRDLSLARDRLQSEIADHRATETRLQIVQHDLVQANRLAILGQVAAGVAHEINQPVATIRAYADNSKVFLERQQPHKIAENLTLIAGLTERIGAITEDLKALARRGRTGAEPVDLAQAIEGARVLLKSRFTGRIEHLIVTPLPPGSALAAADVKEIPVGPPAGIYVNANRLRLEQVFINLFQNALEAVGDDPAGRVMVSVVLDGDRVSITVADNGPGIPPDILGAMFTPFNSSKEKGLGLGLVISKDIVTDYGGRIDVQSDTNGTRFTVHLARADA